MSAGQPVAADHQLAVVFSYNPKRTPAEMSSVSDWPQPFPAYPDAYEDLNRSGSVTYHFVAGPDGLPTEPHVDSSDGGDAFGQSVLAWLASGCVHFRPHFQQGKPVDTPFTAQTVHFKGSR